MACRAIPHHISTIEELALPPVVTRTRRGGARHRAAHRDHRLGQVDDARGDDRPHQPHDEQAHRHDRGPDRVRPQRRALGHQPARSRHGHRVVQARAAQGAAPGPGRDPRRRDARRGDRADGAVGRRDRTPRALDDPHGRRDRVDQPHARLLPATPARPGAQHDRGHASRASSHSGWCPAQTADAWPSARSCA